jgi:hypothetical protein
MYEYETLKPVDVVLRMEGRGRIMEGINQTRVHCMQIWKCHNKYALYNYYILMKTLRNNLVTEGNTYHA